MKEKEKKKARLMIYSNSGKFDKESCPGFVEENYGNPTLMVTLNPFIARSPALT